MASVICRLFGIIIILGVIVSVLPITIPKFMGYEIYNVTSGSMEPQIPVGSVVYVKSREPAQIAEGEVIAFYSGSSVITHRCVENHLIEGRITTKGDANPLEDLGDVSYRDVIGVVEHHFPVIGNIMTVLAGTMGKILLLCLAVCGALLIVLGGRLKS